MRTITAQVEKMGGPKIVIENRPGGGGVTATLGVKDAPPDGRTLMLASYATHVINPAMAGGTQYDPIADFQPITTLFSFPVMLSVPTALEARTVPELVALAKRKPGGLSYASQGVGTAGHLLGELFKKSSGAPLVHVPYKGAAPGGDRPGRGPRRHDVRRRAAEQGAPRRRLAARRSPSRRGRECRRCRTHRPWPRSAIPTSTRTSSGSD